MSQAAFAVPCKIQSPEIILNTQISVSFYVFSYNWISILRSHNVSDKVLHKSRTLWNKSVMRFIKIPTSYSMKYFYPLDLVFFPSNSSLLIKLQGWTEPRKGKQMFITSRVLSKKLDRKLPKLGKKKKKDPLCVFFILNTDLSLNALTFIHQNPCW